MSVRTLLNLDATRDCARQVAGFLQVDDVVLLDGPLGAGKTTFTKALVDALGGDQAAVASPTFTLLHQYQARIPIVHVDAYRLGGPQDLDGLGFHDLTSESIAVVEWAERVADAFVGHRSCWRIRLAHAAEGQRSAVIEPPARCAAAWHAQASNAQASNDVPDSTEAAHAAVQPVSVVQSAASAAEPATPAASPGSPPRSGTPAAIITIPADSDGRDPLTKSYLHDHRQTCAAHTVSWPWLIVAVPVTALAGVLACRYHGTGEGLTLLGDWPAFLLGAAGSASVLSLLGALRCRLRPTLLPIAQESWLAATLVALLYVIFYDPLIGLGLVTALLCAVYLGAIGFRLLALVLGGKRGLRNDVLQAPLGGWPLYTVLVPLYREKAVARNILAALERLDYPRERLDVKFLLEADDPDTLPALQAAGIPSWAEVVVVPHAQPKTKPRACNHGLQRARGEFLVIFDAEDRPEPDQLKQAVLAFHAAPPKVVCLQAQLAYHNHRQNLLTRWFAMEYNVWFRRYLPGLARLGVPIPLGGTSNHFRIAPLQAVGGWDPFNVTEDCDLGVRLHLLGHRTALLDSTTWEEANSVTGNWLRQRSRWLKGYFVTHVVWGRRPLWLAMRLGPWALGGFLLSVLLVPLLAATNLILWAYATLYATLVGIDLAHGHRLWSILAERDWADERLSWPMWFAGPLEDPLFSNLSQIFFIASVTLLLGNLAFIVIAGLCGRRPGQRGVWAAALLLPGYWVLISIAAWKGLWQAMIKPHYWEKTIHGLDTHPEEKPKG